MLSQVISVERLDAEQSLAFATIFIKDQYDRRHKHGFSVGEWVMAQLGDDA